MLRPEAIFFVCVVCVVKSDFISDINPIVDRQIIILNEFIQQNNGLTLKIPPGNIGKDVYYEEGTMLELKSLERSGNCFLVYRDDGSVTLELHLAIDQLAIYFTKLTYRESTGSAHLTANKTSFNISYIIALKGPCDVALSSFYMEDYDGISFASEIPHFDTGYSEQIFESLILPEINRKLDDIRLYFDNILQTLVCHSTENSALYLLKNHILNTFFNYMLVI